MPPERTFQRAYSPQHKEQRVTDLMRAARALAARDGVRTVTLTAIATQAGVHVSAVPWVSPVARRARGRCRRGRETPARTRTARHDAGVGDPVLVEPAGPHLELGPACDAQSDMGQGDAAFAERFGPARACRLAGADT